MTAPVLTKEQLISLASVAGRLRRELQLTTRELADMAGITPQEVVLFENGLPVRLDARRSIMKELWAFKHG
jgi:transcriptional regulator with XRE-family HTH domain